MSPPAGHGRPGVGAVPPRRPGPAKHGFTYIYSLNRRCGDPHQVETKTLPGTGIQPHRISGFKISRTPEKSASGALKNYLL